MLRLGIQNKPSGPLPRLRGVSSRCAHDPILSNDEVSDNPGAVQKDEFVRRGAVEDPTKVGYVLSLVSSQVGMEKNDFLRQVVGYEYPNYPWEKDNYFVRSEHRDLVESLVNELANGASTA